MRGIPLKIAVQFALTLRNRQLIIRLGKVVNADILIACVSQCVDGITEHGQFVGRAWQIGFIDLTLTFKSLWQMRIVKNRQTVWRDSDDALNRIAHAIHRLVRQPINQVNIDRMKPKAASFRHHASNHFF